MAAREFLQRWIPRDERKVRRFLVIFYMVGIAGFILPFSREPFVHLTGLALLLSTFLLFWFHKSGFDYKSIVLFIAIYLAGFLIEVIGVGTGAIFGEYAYGNGLGPKLWDTPLMIGVNWLMLSYCFASVLKSFNFNGLFIIIFASAGMLAYDIVMEQVAPMLDLWYWSNDTIPLENYIAWFVIAFAFQSLIVFSRIRLRNPIALTLLLCQFGFFLVLAIYKLVAS
ncbi:MAG: carotenoid biosynthesis protein [Bacteroidales bacterium]|jgi:putative membrane protein|nr:carotenoid biosynthesis protein [Bacteroidales bacterium]